MNLKEYVEQTNAEFEAASPQEKRVMIAKDVIKRLEAKNIVAATGDIIHEEFDKSDKSSFKDYINEAKNCEVCGKGALLCAYVGRVNKFSLGDTQKWGQIEGPDSKRLADKIHPKLKELFTIAQLDLIETAFEGGSYLYKAAESKRDKAKEYYYQYPSPSKRLIAICKNIIENNGEFKP